MPDWGWRLMVVGLFVCLGFLAGHFALGRSASTPLPLELEPIPFHVMGQVTPECVLVKVLAQPYSRGCLFLVCQGIPHALPCAGIP